MLLSQDQNLKNTLWKQVFTFMFTVIDSNTDSIGSPK